MNQIEIGKTIMVEPNELKARMYDKLVELIESGADVNSTVEAFEYVLEEIGVNDGYR